MLLKSLSQSSDNAFRNSKYYELIHMSNRIKILIYHFESLFSEGDGLVLPH